MTSRPVAIGVDIGGTNLRVAAVTGDGTVVARHTASTPVPRGAGTSDAADLVDAVATAVESVSSPDLPVGVGVAGLVDRDGRLLEGPNLGVADVPLAADLSVRWPTVVANDATCAAWGEHRVGAGRGVDDLVLLTIGTGVGGGAVVAGRLLAGSSGLAGEFGHVVVEADGRRCPCGSRGCLEAHASGRALGVLAGDRLAAGQVSSLSADEVVDGAAVTAAAAAGDDLARDVLAEAGRWLGVGLASLVNVLDPARVLVGGGAGTAAAEWLLPSARAAMEPRILGYRRRRVPEITTAALGDDAGVIGAALLAADTAGR